MVCDYCGKEKPDVRIIQDSVDGMTRHLEYQIRNYIESVKDKKIEPFPKLCSEDYARIVNLLRLRKK